MENRIENDKDLRGLQAQKGLTADKDPSPQSGLQHSLPVRNYPNEGVLVTAHL